MSPPTSASRRFPFDCPICRVLTESRSFPLHFDNGLAWEKGGLWLLRCSHCHGFTYWQGEPSVHEGRVLSGHMIWPIVLKGPPPHQDMPEAVRLDYEEARKIEGTSPRAAAALLRLAIERLCAEFGATGRSINDCIADLRRRGTPDNVRKTLDLIRVVGNNAVHVGEFQSAEIADIIPDLFALMNWIVEEMISMPRRVNHLIERLPESSRNVIRMREEESPVAH